MNPHDDPLLESFASELHREFSPVPPSPNLVRGVAAALASPASPAVAASWTAAFLQSRSWFAWTSFATAAVLAVALVVATGWGPRQGSPAAARTKRGSGGRDAGETAVAVSPAPGAEAFPRTAPRGATVLPTRDLEPSGTATTSDFYRPVVLRDRRDFVDTLRLRDRRTGARVEVSYPRAEFVLVAAEPM